MLVAGLINIETTVKIEKFPIEYSPILFPFYGVDSTVSGVAISIPKAIDKLGKKSKIVSYIGEDIQGELVLKEFEKNDWGTDYIINELDRTPQSVVLYDEKGTRKIYCDLKNIQDKSVDVERIRTAVKESNVCILCNSNFTRGLLKIAKEEKKIIATDVHVLGNIHDEYNKEFLEYADILFLSHENIPYDTKRFICDLKDTYNSKIIVIGLGKDGAMMYVRAEDSLYKMDSVEVRPIVNTVGAGDALFSSFVYFYSKGEDPITCLKKAQSFASYKIGENGASNGFLSEKELNELYLGINFKLNKIF